MFVKNFFTWFLPLFILSLKLGSGQDQHSDGPLGVIFTNRVSLMKLQEGTRRTASVIIDKLRNVVALDYDYRKKLVVWSDVQTKGIFSADITTGDALKVIVKDDVQIPDGLSVDWIYGNVYWTDTGTDTISVASLDGSMRKLLFNKDLEEPRAIVVNPSEGWMFWTDWGSHPKIERAGMDGTLRSTIISKDIAVPNGLAIDLEGKRLFWTDTQYHAIRSSDYDGSNVKEIYNSLTDLGHPFALDVYGDWLYFTDWRSQTLSRMSKTAGNGVENIVLGVTFPMGVRVYSSHKQPKGIRYCGEGEGCLDLCLPAPKESGRATNFTCACPDNMECKHKAGSPQIIFSDILNLRKMQVGTPNVASVIVEGLSNAVALDYHYEKNLVVWSDVKTKVIYSANLSDGDSKSVLMKDDILTPDGLSIDWIYNNIYWTDTGTNSINVASLDGKMRKVLFRKDLDEPRAIVLNPLEGWMFWTDWGNNAKIERAGMDGTFRSTIVSKDIDIPNGLAIDFESRKLFWVDAKYKSIKCSDYDGANVKEIQYSLMFLGHPYAIDVFGDSVYWTDWGSESIYKANKSNGSDLETIIKVPTKPMGMRVYNKNKQPKGERDCGEENKCLHLCVKAPKRYQRSKNFTCLCPDGMDCSEKTEMNDSRWKMRSYEL